MDVVESVRLFAVELLLSKMMFPVPDVPPETVNDAAPLLSVKVVDVLLTVMAVVLMSNADVAELSVIAVTLAPTPPLMVVTLLLVPELVIVPALLTEAVDKVTEEDASTPLMVRFPVPVMPPLKVNE